MQEFNNPLAALLPTLNLSVAQDTSQEPGKSLINVTELARSRYSYQVPVFISPTTYQRCVAVPLAQDTGTEASEILRLFKVLALAKYAIRHADPGATWTEFTVPLNDHKFNSAIETLVAQVFPGNEAAPALLIRPASEPFFSAMGKLKSDLMTGLNSIKEAL